jgi:hypothetical protein
MFSSDNENKESLKSESNVSSQSIPDDERQKNPRLAIDSLGFIAYSTINKTNSLKMSLKYGQLHMITTIR